VETIYNSKTEIRKTGTLNNIRTILNTKQNELTCKQCKILSKCLGVLSKENVSLLDSMKIERYLTEGNFNVLLPY